MHTAATTGAPGRLTLRRRCALVALSAPFVALALSLIVEAGFGAGPATLLTLGIARATPLGIGASGVALTVGYAVAAWLLGCKPGAGSVTAVVAANLLLEQALEVLPTPEAVAGRSAFFAGGTLLLASAIAMLAAADLGTAPIESFMFAVAARGFPLGRVRIVMDTASLLAGAALGAPAGVGTVMLALTLGPIVAAAVRFSHRFVPGGA